MSEDRARAGSVADCFANDRAIAVGLLAVVAAVTIVKLFK